MLKSRVLTHSVCAALLFVLCSARVTPAEEQSTGIKFPRQEKLNYRIEWRLVTAGTVNLQFVRSGEKAWQIQLDLESAGLVSRLYRVADTYRVFADDHFCGSSARLDAQEGRKHNQTQLNFDSARKKVIYDERDLVKNSAKHDELDLLPCTHEIAGALAALSELDLPAGKSTTLPVTDGKKMARVRIDAQAKETIAIDDKKYQTIRYEAFVFDNILYRRKGSLLVWITDDAERTPVQFRLQLGFPVGTISVQLQKQQEF